ncbi:MAG: hypothetical protein IRY83_13240 [Chloroflexi bacterium]|nr:hypothetical protein [Chloroflexota bacterium]
MLQYQYSSEDEIPDGLREHYVERDGQYVLNVGGLPTRLAELEEEVRQLRERQLPAGHVAVTEAEARALAAYRELGRPHELRAALEAYEHAQSKLAAIEREQTLRRAAELAGLRPEPFVAVAAAKQLQVEIREVDDDGTRTERAFVRLGEDQLDLREYVERDREWNSLMPALVAQPGGVPYPPQQSAATAEPVNPARAYIARVYQGARKDGANAS